MKMTDPPAKAFEEPDSRNASEGRDRANGNNASEGRDPATGQFVKGFKGGPGRRKGARARWSEAFMADVEEAWQDMGPAAIRRALFNDPAGTIRALIGILPKHAKLEITTTLEELSDERLAEMLDYVERMAGLQAEQAKVIDVTPTLPAPRRSDAAGGVAVTIETLATPPSRSPGRDAAAAAKRADLEDQAAATRHGEPARPSSGIVDEINPEDLF